MNKNSTQVTDYEDLMLRRYGVYVREICPTADSLMLLKERSHQTTNRMRNMDEYNYVYLSLMNGCHDVKLRVRKFAYNVADIKGISIQPNKSILRSTLLIQLCRA
jgi:hypothetical protein